MLLATLIVLNIPVYLFIGWLAFDSKANAGDTFWETVVAIALIILIPRILRVLLDIDTDGSWGIFTLAGFLLACGFIVYGEYFLLSKWFA